MRIAITLFMLVFLQCSVGWSAFTDFSDYTQSVSFDSDEVFQSNGLRFKALNLFPYENGNARIAVHTGSIHGPSHKLHPGPGVEFLLPGGVQEMSLTYSDGAGSNIVINGLQPSFPQGVPRFFSLLNGTALAGISIETNLSTQYSGLEEGTLTLRGPISSLVIAGIELNLDEVSVIVPEPATTSLILATSISLFVTRRRRHA